MADTTSLGYVPVDKSGDTMTGDLILNADPTTALQAATKQYVDGLTVEGDFKEAARVATTGNLTATYDNGASGVGATLTNSGAMAAISIDGVSLSANDRVLVKDQTSQDENGIYYVSVVGDGATNWVLTRSEDFDMADEMTAGATLVVYAGTANASTGWLLDSDITTIGTDNIVFSQLTAPPSSAAPSDATYIVQTANGTLTNEQALDTLSDGLLKHASGVVAQAVAGTDYLAPAAIGVTVQGYDAGLDSIAGLTTAANTLIYTTALDTYAVISAANSSVLVTSGTGVPSLSTAIPDGVTATTQSASDNSTKLATTAYVDNAVSGGGHAPVGATYITQTPNGSLTNEQAMSTLATGLVKNTTTTGVQSIAVAGTDYLAPSAIGTTVQAYDAGLQSISGLTTAANTMLYTTALDTYAVIAASNSSVLVTNGSGVPSLSTAIPDGVTATTQSASDNSTKIATTAYVDAATGSASGDAISKDVTQANSFAVGDVIRFNGTNYVAAQADSAANAESVGVVSAATGSDFTVVYSGYISGLSGLTSGSVYFLDPSTAGDYTATEPSTAGQISKPVFVAISTTEAIVINYRGVEVASSASSTAINTWVTFDASSGSPVIDDDLNITSITDNGTGDFDLNFTTNYADTDYCISQSAGGQGTSFGESCYVHDKQVGLVQVKCGTSGGGIDMKYNHVMILGNLS